MAEHKYIASTRHVYDFSAADYASKVGTTVTAAFERPIDRAVLHAFSEDLLAVVDARVLDVGCGVGRVTSFLHERGLKVSGIDLSVEMIAVAHSSHPHLPFDVASMTDLPVDDHSVDAVVLWYSIIHLPPPALPEVWNEVARVLTANGRMLLGFQAGENDIVRRENAYGSSTTMTWYRHNVDDVVRSVERAGFVVQTRIWRTAELAHETTPQAFLICERLIPGTPAT
jgi:ubiquinone/menaquinone biosynthesis C-methylase UbiE